MYKAYKVRLHQTKKQAELIDETIGCCRYVYNSSLADRMYKCDCGFEIDRDLNAAVNIKNEFLKSVEYTDNRHGEVVRPRRLVYKPQGSFIEVSTNSL